MYCLFNNCQSLTTLALFDTSNVTNTSYMFHGCSSLLTIPVFDTSSVLDMSYMFADCSSLVLVPLLNTLNVTNMSYMFQGCSSLTMMTLLDTSNITNMQNMCYDCISLSAVPLFNTTEAENTQYMFKNCYKVESGALALYQQVSTQHNELEYYKMFENCGRDTQTGAAELAQIPEDWGGTYSEDLVIDGRTYKTVKIGNQEWMAENLDWKFPYNGSILPIGQNGEITTPAAWYYNNNETAYGVNGNKYGLLYNWYAAKYLNDNKSTLIPGWRVPTMSDCEKLLTTLGGSAVNNTGVKLKSTTDWQRDTSSILVGTDDYGFNAKPAGYRSSGGAFFSWLSTATRYLTSEKNSNDYAGTAILSYASNKLTVKFDKSIKEAWSIRLIRDV